jgi:hypothetical protein
MVQSACRGAISGVDRRTSGWSTVAGLMEAQNGSAVPPVGYRTDQRCHVCSAPDRDLPNGWAVRNLIDEMLIIPKTYSAILRLVEPLMENWPNESRISRYSLTRHARNHLQWERASARRIAERNAERAGKVEEASERMLVTQAVLEAIQTRGFEAIISGEVTPSVRDTLSASRTLRQIELEAGGRHTAAEALAKLDRVIQVIREEVPEERWESILARLEGQRPLPAQSAPDPAWDDIVAEMGEDAFRA